MRIRELRALEGVGAHQLGQSIGLVRRRGHHRPHLVQTYIEATRGQLPRCFRAGQPATNDSDALSHTATASGDGATSHSFAHLMQRR